MSWEASGHVKKMLDCPDGAALSTRQKLLLLVLADYHNTSKRLAWPSLVTLAEESLSSIAQVKRDLAYLEDHKAIVRSRTKQGRGAINSYKFVGIDVALRDVIRKVKTAPKETPETAHGEPFFSTEENGSDSAHKGLTEVLEKGSETAHGGDCNKEEPEPREPKSQSQHGKAALKAWLGLKDEMRNHLSAEEWDLWVRPALLHRVIWGGNNCDGIDTLLIALPANGRIMHAAVERRPLLRRLAGERGYSLGMTTYPDDYELDRMRREYPEQFEQMFGKGKRNGGGQA